MKILKPVLLRGPNTQLDAVRQIATVLPHEERSALHSIVTPNLMFFLYYRQGMSVLAVHTSRSGAGHDYMLKHFPEISCPLDVIWLFPDVEWTKPEFTTDAWASHLPLETMLPKLCAHGGTFVRPSGDGEEFCYSVYATEPKPNDYIEE